MTEALTSLGVPVASGLFVFAAVGVLVAGTRLTYLADAISERFKLSKSLMGLLFLATATSLPEIATTFGAALRESKELVLNNLYGGVALQTAILALADFWVRGSITYYPRRMNHLLEVVLLILLLTFTIMIILQAIAFFYRSYLELKEGEASEGKYLDKDQLGDEDAQLAAEVH